jgi:hypothetical protein
MLGENPVGKTILATSLGRFNGDDLVVEEVRSAAGGDLSVNPLVSNVARLQSLIFDRRCTLKSVTCFYMSEWENSP